MKKSVKMFLLAACCVAFIITIISSCKTQQRVVTHGGDSDLGRVTPHNGKYIFVYSEPVTDYETAFTFEDKIANINCLSTEQIMNHAITNASLEAGLQNKLFDGIIIGTNHRDIAITFKDKTKDNSIARVHLENGIYVFIECEPLTDYIILKKREVNGNLTKELTGKCPTLQNKIDKLMQRAKNKADAVMFSSTKYDQVIQFIPKKQ